MGGGSLFLQLALNVAMCILVAHMVLKLIAIVNAIRWISRNGEKYRKKYRKLRPETDEDKLKLLRSTGGHFFPFGAKDYKVRRSYMIAATDTRFVKARKYALRLWLTLFFTAPGLVAFSTLLILVPPIATKILHVQPALALVASVLFVVLSAALYFEAVAWYHSVKGYARPFFTLGFHRTRYESTGGGLAELRTYIYLVLSALLSNSVLCFVTGTRLKAFTYVPSGTPKEDIDFVAASLLHTASSMSFLGESYLRPANAIGFTLGVVDLSMGVVLILFGLAILPMLISRMR